jgi:hypothetical protein
MNIIKNSIKILDTILNGVGNQPPFIIYFQDFNKKVNEMSIAIKFSGLISSQDYKNSVEIATYPRVNGKFSTSGLFRTEGASVSLKVIMQYDGNADEEVIAQSDNAIYEQLTLVQYDPRNLYIPANSAYNLAYDLKNYRITSFSAEDRDKNNVTIYTLQLEQITVTNWKDTYNQMTFTKPEYSDVSNQGSPNTKVL